mmetsp:Transcript_86976/g.243828  ORF Transcript_86976/g.243828 Transcript_86976/m.243828 type:complete len:261 (-) Transcript_86976:89-871(-)
MDTASWNSGLNSSPTDVIFSTPSFFQVAIMPLKRASNLSQMARSPSPSTLRFCFARSNSSAIGISSLMTGMLALPRAAASSFFVRVLKLLTSMVRRSCAACFSSTSVLSSAISVCNFSHAAVALAVSSSSESLSLCSLLSPPPKKRRTCNSARRRRPPRRVDKRPATKLKNANVAKPAAPGAEAFGLELLEASTSGARLSTKCNGSATGARLSTRCNGRPTAGAATKPSVSRAPTATKSAAGTLATSRRRWRVARGIDAA